MKDLYKSIEVLRRDYSLGVPQDLFNRIFQREKSLEETTNKYSEEANERCIVVVNNYDDLEMEGKHPFMGKHEILAVALEKGLNIKSSECIYTDVNGYIEKSEYLSSELPCLVISQETYQNILRTYATPKHSKILVVPEVDGIQEDKSKKRKFWEELKQFEKWI